MDCSPRTNRKASAMLDFPEPFGPTIAETFEVKLSSLFLAKLLNPESSIDFRYIKFSLIIAIFKQQKKHTHGRRAYLPVVCSFVEKAITFPISGENNEESITIAQAMCKITEVFLFIAASFYRLPAVFILSIPPALFQCFAGCVLLRILF